MARLAVGIRLMDERREKGERTRSAAVALVLREVQRHLADVAPASAKRTDEGEKVASSRFGCGSDRRLEPVVERTQRPVGPVFTARHRRQRREKREACERVGPDARERLVRRHPSVLGGDDESPHVVCGQAAEVGSRGVVARRGAARQQRQQSRPIVRVESCSTQMSVGTEKQT